VKRLFLCLLLLSAALRLWQVANFPQGLQVDEVAFGYNTYSLLKTGRDEFGQSLPLMLRSFDDNKAAVYAYLDAPAMALLGPTNLAVRLPTALFGIGLVILTYLLSWELTKNKRLAILAAFVTATAPISILLSRIQNEPLVATFFVTLGFYLYVRQKNFWAATFWVLAMLTSTIPRVFLMVFLPVLIFLNLRHTKTALLFSAVILAGVILFFQSSLARYDQVSVFKSLHVQLPQEESIREDGHDQALLARAFHNKPLVYGRFLVNNFFNYLSFEFLFHEAPLPLRERIPSIGVLYLAELPFLLLGLWNIFSRKPAWGALILAWLFIVPASLSFASDETPNIHRFYLAIIPLSLVIALGLCSVRRLGAVLVAAVFAFSLAFFLHQLIVHQPVHKPYYRDYAYQGLVAAAGKYSADYDRVIVTTAQSNSYIFFLFFNRFDPQVYQRSGSKGNVDGQGFDKYVFTSVECPRPTDPRTLYIQKGTCDTLPYREKLLETVSWGDGSPAFKIVKYP
jgi:4-amino-4-deoxy-L-arabinose transferase-like glycosyltransferase